MRFPCHGRELGWSDPCGLLATSLWPKVGSLQPSPVFCPRPKSTVASHATAMLRVTSVHRRGERNGEPWGEPRRSRTVHPVRRGLQSGMLWTSHRIDLVPHLGKPKLK